MNTNNTSTEHFALVSYFDSTGVVKTSFTEGKLFKIETPLVRAAVYRDILDFVQAKYEECAKAAFPT